MNNKLNALMIIIGFVFFNGCTPSAYLTKLPTPMTKDEMTFKFVYETELEENKVFDELKLKKEQNRIDKIIRDTGRKSGFCNNF